MKTEAELREVYEFYMELLRTNPSSGPSLLVGGMVLSILGWVLDIDNGFKSDFEELLKNVKEVKNGKARQQPTVC